MTKEKEIKYCKCGHRGKPNHVKMKRILNWEIAITQPCSSCYCQSFVNRKSPTRLDTVTTLILFGIIAFSIGALLFASVSWMQLADEHKAQLEKKSSDMNQYQLVMLGSTTLLIMVFFLASYGLSPFFYWLRIRNQKIMPIDDKEENKP